jgi:hypothetical protein
MKDSFVVPISKKTRSRLGHTSRILWKAERLRMVMATNKPSSRPKLKLKMKTTMTTNTYRDHH